MKEGKLKHLVSCSTYFCFALLSHSLLSLFSVSSPCSFSSPLPAHYKNSMIMLQTWAAEQITFREGECGDGTSREAGKDSHWVTKRERMREIARGMSSEWNYCKARKKNYMKKEKERGRKSLETRDNREDLKRKKLQKFSWGPGEKRKGDL